MRPSNRRPCAAGCLCISAVSTIRRSNAPPSSAMATSATWLVDLYIEKLRACGNDLASARIHIQGLFYVVAHDRDKALNELAPYFLHVNNSYGQWLNEDRASTGMGDATVLKPLTLEAFK